MKITQEIKELIERMTSNLNSDYTKESDRYSDIANDAEQISKTIDESDEINWYE